MHHKETSGKVFCPKKSYRETVAQTLTAHVKILFAATHSTTTKTKTLHHATRGTKTGFMFSLEDLRIGVVFPITTIRLTKAPKDVY